MAKKKGHQALERVRDICLALPDAHETLTWGKPHFRVKDKIFCGYGDEDGIPTIGFKLEMDHARQIAKIPGFRPAAYVGHKGWISMDVSAVDDWETVEELIHESFRLIAPKRTLARWQVPGTGPPKKATKKGKPSSRTKKKAASGKRGKKIAATGKSKKGTRSVPIKHPPRKGKHVAKRRKARKPST